MFLNIKMGIGHSEKQAHVKNREMLRGKFDRTCASRARATGALQDGRTDGQAHSLQEPEDRILIKCRYPHICRVNGIPAKIPAGSFVETDKVIF